MKADRNLLFVSLAGESEYASFAARIFDVEATKMDLAWIAEARVFPGSSVSTSDDALSLSAPLMAEMAKELGIETYSFNDSVPDLTSNDIESAGLLMALVKADVRAKLEQDYKTHKGKLEFCLLAKDKDSIISIRDAIKSLIVRLILQGGKRISSTTGMGAQYQQALNVHAGAVKDEKSQSKQKSETVRVMLDKKGRRGKVVTTISGFSLDDDALENLAAALKKLCGSGGTVSDRHIEIQGDHRDRLIAELTARGFKPKRIG